MKILNKSLKIAGKVVLIILALLLVVVAVLNVLKFAIYSDYYAAESALCKNPGLNDGFICQGIAVDEKAEKVFVSGYMKDGSASRIYVTDFESNSYHVQLSKGGEVFKGHCGGIAYTNGMLYVANGGRIYTIAESVLLSAQNGDEVEVGEGVKVNYSASFIYTDDEFIYVGEFHDGGKYNIEGHETQTAEGTHSAMCAQYRVGDFSSPVKVFSIRNKVQGICFSEGKVVMSTSYGLASSEYFVYDLSKATDSGKTFDGAPLYYLDNLSYSISGPAMSEDLDYFDGKVVTLTESASNKYVFGKFFNSKHIVALDLLK